MAEHSRLKRIMGCKKRVFLQPIIQYKTSLSGFCLALTIRRQTRFFPALTSCIQIAFNDCTFFFCIFYKQKRNDIEHACNGRRKNNELTKSSCQMQPSACRQIRQPDRRLPCSRERQVPKKQDLPLYRLTPW